MNAMNKGFFADFGIRAQGDLSGHLVYNSAGLVLPDMLVGFVLCRNGILSHGIPCIIVGILDRAYKVSDDGQIVFAGTDGLLPEMILVQAY